MTHGPKAFVPEDTSHDTEEGMLQPSKLNEQVSFVPLDQVQAQGTGECTPFSSQAAWCTARLYVQALASALC